MGLYETVLSVKMFSKIIMELCSVILEGTSSIGDGYKV